MNEQPGEVIDLSWEYGPAEHYVVRGHVTPEEFRSAWDDYHQEVGWTALHAEAPRQVFARWLFDGSEDGGRTLTTYAEGGPGRFRVTLADRRDDAPR